MLSIIVSHLGKAYKHYSSHWARLTEWIIPHARPRYHLKWILQDISFTIQSGESVGIVGINGAGKSTLLKIITGTTQPTAGFVQTQGRVAALLELGMGFHSDFTGRQNVFMAGQLLGYTVEDIRTLMPQIESFAEIGDYIDLPVRVYSSGMQMRLAFSVATARRPDVLIVDEALSVGDAYFQHKSFDRIREFRKNGTTLLLVSHDKQAIQSICDRAILLNAGRIAMEGEPEAVMDYYNAMLADNQSQDIKQEVLSDGKTQTVSGTGEATVDVISLVNPSGESLEVVDVGAPVRLRIDATVHAPIKRLVLGYAIKDRLGQVMHGTNTDFTQQPLHDLAAGTRFRFEIVFPVNFGPGAYSIQTALVSSDTHLINNYEWRDLAFVFTVVNISKPHFAGCTWLNPTIVINQI